MKTKNGMGAIHEYINEEDGKRYTMYEDNKRAWRQLQETDKSLDAKKLAEGKEEEERVGVAPAHSCLCIVCCQAYPVHYLRYFHRLFEK